MANKRYTTIPNDHCITFDNYAQIKELDDDEAKKAIKGGGFNFTSLKEVSEATQVYMIDVIAVLTEVQPVGQIQLKSTGEFRDKRSVTLTDDTGVNIMATLWGDICNNDKLQEGAIIAVKGAKVSEYGGKSLNIDSGGLLLIDPQEEERFHQLAHWYSKSTQNGQTLKTESLTQLGEGGVNP